MDSPDQEMGEKPEEFGGLYVEPEWPVGAQGAGGLRLKRDSIVVEPSRER